MASETPALATLAEESAKRARNAAVLALLALAVAVAVLAIDNGIKKAILDEAAKARALLDEFTTIAREAGAGGKKAADDAGASDSPGVDGSGVLVDAAGPPAAADNDAPTRQQPKDREPNGRFARPRGDG